MKIVKIIIERSSDGYFWGYADNVEGINGGGETAQSCKQDVLDCIEILKEFEGENRPPFLDKPYELVYKFDTESLLEYYKGIFSKAAFERLTGINQHQISHYASGLKKPRREQRKKIESALHQLGEELLTVEL